MARKKDGESRHEIIENEIKRILRKDKASLVRLAQY